MQRLILLLFLFSEIISFAQDSIKKPIIWGFRTHYAFILPHSEELKSVSKSKPFLLETDLSWVLTSKNVWDYCFCYPRAGITLSYMDFNNPEIIGKALALTPYIEPLLSFHQKFNISYRIGMGFTWLSTPYDSITNPENLFYSTHYAFTIMLNYVFNYRIANNYNLRLSINFNHISNGGIQKPNKGINFPSVSFGVDYYLYPENIKKRSKSEKKQLYSDKTTFSIITYLTQKAVDRNNEDEKFFVLGIESEISKLVGRISKINFGIDVCFDGSLKEEVRRYNWDMDYKRIGILAGHELLIGRFTFSQQLGVYIYSPIKPRDPVYQRWGLIFQVNKFFSFGINLKTHRHVADFMDLRTVFSW